MSGLCGRGNEELLFNGYRVSVAQVKRKRVPWMVAVAAQECTVNSTFKMAYMMNFMLYLYNHNWTWTKQAHSTYSLTESVRQESEVTELGGFGWARMSLLSSAVISRGLRIHLHEDSLTKLLAGGLGSSLCGPIHSVAWCLHNIVANTTPRSEWPKRECEEEAMVPFLNLRSDVLLFLPDFVY